jgi:predicted transcriptional regulator
MDSETAVPKRPRLNPYGKALRRERIFARLRMGWTYEDIAGEERVTPRRVRQIVSEALKRQKADGGSDHAMLQCARLENALRLSAQRVAGGEIAAIATYLKVLAGLDRDQSAAKANPVYDQAARERLLAKLNRAAARLERAEARKAAKSRDSAAAEAPAPERSEAIHPNSPASP